MLNTKIKNHDQIQKTVILALFTALSFLIQFVFRIKVQFLTFDAKDAVMTGAAMIYGPLYGLIISFAVALLEAITISSTGIWGFLMNFLGSASFVLISSLVYKYKRTLGGAIAGLSLSVLFSTVVMLGLNILITPIYMGVAVRQVLTLIPTLLLPFNLMKAVFNAGLVLLLYKPIVRAMRKAKLVESGEYRANGKRSSVVVFVLALIFIMIGVVGFLVLNGKINFFR